MILTGADLRGATLAGAICHLAALVGAYLDEADLTGADYDHLPRWLRQRGIVPRIARRGIEPSTRLGRHRWRIEPLLAQLFGYPRLATRYERWAGLYCTAC